MLPNNGYRKTIKSAILMGLLTVSSASVWAAKAVNINKADAITLAESLDGIGQKRAEAIVEYRSQNGPFTSLDQVSDVAGIGEKIVERNSEFIQME